MKIIGIDNDKCIKCIECVNIFPQKLYIKPPTIVGEKRHVFFNDPDNKCEECKLCIEICPTDAIIYVKNT